MAYNGVGYGNRRGYGGDDGREYYDKYNGPVQNCPYQINQTVRHIGTGAKLIVIKIGREQVECRKPDLGADWFYLYEIEPIGSNE